MLSNDQARKTLEQILDNPEFSQARQLGLLEDLIRGLLEQFGLSGFNGKIESMGTLLEWLIFLVGFVLIIYLTRLAAPFWNVLTSDVQEDQVSENPFIRPSPANLLSEAEKKASQGDYRHALRDLYLSLLIEMDNRHLITYGTTKTNSEYLREISNKAQGLDGPFRSMVDLFEYKWYGLEDCSREDFQKGRALYSALLKEASHV